MRGKEEDSQGGDEREGRRKRVRGDRRKSWGAGDSRRGREKIGERVRRRGYERRLMKVGAGNCVKFGEE